MILIQKQFVIAVTPLHINIKKTHTNGKVEQDFLASPTIPAYNKPSLHHQTAYPTEL